MNLKYITNILTFGFSGKLGKQRLEEESILQSCKELFAKHEKLLKDYDKLLDVVIVKRLVINAMHACICDGER